MKLKVIINPDGKYVKTIRQALKENQGYCPCMLEKKPETKCMCEKFREQQTEGFCHCGLYEKVFVEQRGEHMLCISGFTQLRLQKQNNSEQKG